MRNYDDEFMPMDIAPVAPVEDCWFLTGPTASGKTLVGVELAKRLGAEIVSLDSMAIYRGMDIGTAKPSPEVRASCPHHLLDIVDPTDEFSVAQYIDAAHRVVGEIRERGHEVLFVGGTPLYLKALLRGIYQGPPADWEFRRQAQREADRLGSEALHEQLALIDPLSYAKLHPKDLRRIIRALEVFHLTGKPISHQQLQFDEGRPAEQCRVFVLGWDRSALHHRIAQRVEGMFSAGLVEEADQLRRRYGQLGRTAGQAVGYREAFAYLDGTMDRAEMYDTVKARTRQFARRQETWFRRMSECTRVPMDAEAAPDEVARRIIDLGSLRASDLAG